MPHTHFAHPSNADKLSPQQLYEEICILSRELAHGGFYPEWAFIGIEVIDVALFHSNHILMLSAQDQGLTIYKLSTPIGNICIRIVPGNILFVSTDPDMSALNALLNPIPAPKPQWSSSQVWMNTGGKALTVRQAQNSELLAFKREDTGEWELSSRYELTNWGFYPRHEGFRF